MRGRRNLHWIISTIFIISLLLHYFISFCGGFNSRVVLNTSRRISSVTPLPYNENDPFDDIRVTKNAGGDADDDDDQEELPSDLPKDIQQDTVDETLQREKTLYEILGASPDATRAELKKCYVRLAKATHPDALIGRSSNAADDNKDSRIKTTENNYDFNDIAAAWRILGDAKLRKRYDFDLKARAFAEQAQRFTNEKLEEAAPVVSAMVENVAATTVAVGDVMGKGMASLFSISKKAKRFSEQAKIVFETMEDERKATNDANKKAAQTLLAKKQALEEELARKKAELEEAKATEALARQRTAQRIAAQRAEEMNARAEITEYNIWEAQQVLAEEQARLVAESMARRTTTITTITEQPQQQQEIPSTIPVDSFEDFLKSSSNTDVDDSVMGKYLEQVVVEEEQQQQQQPQIVATNSDSLADFLVTPPNQDEEEDTMGKYLEQLNGNGKKEPLGYKFSGPSKGFGQ